LLVEPRIFGSTMELTPKIKEKTHRAKDIK